MSESIAVPESRRPDFLISALWFLASLSVLLVWGLIGAFALLPFLERFMTSETSFVPTWAVICAYAFLQFVWPLALLLMTIPATHVHTWIRRVYIFIAATGLASAAYAFTGLPGRLSFGTDEFAWGRDLIIPGKYGPAALSLITTVLLVAVIVIDGWFSRRSS